MTTSGMSTMMLHRPKTARRDLAGLLEPYRATRVPRGGTRRRIRSVGWLVLGAKARKR